ncbi:MAG TPA: hypothetical protein PKJ52_01195 [Rectinema sp.]|nr:hypothetical protein [Rectinema sp.]
MTTIEIKLIQDDATTLSFPKVSKEWSYKGMGNAEIVEDAISWMNDIFGLDKNPQD